MDPILLVILLIAVAVVLVGLEMLLPTHGILGVAGALALCGAVVVTFSINRWAGTALFVGSVIAAPFVASGMLKVWERSPVGRRIMLHAVTAPIEHERIRVGDVGTTASELRPMGQADFGPVAVQVIAHRGSIAPGTRVRVIDYHDGIATVEPVDAAVA